MNIRLRRLRTTQAIRDMVAEVRLHPSDFIAPLFVTEGKGKKEEIKFMPDYHRFSLDFLVKEVKELWNMGCRSTLLFAKIPHELKDNTGREALNPHGLMQRAIREIKNAVPEICLMTDVALDPYSSHGHDGIVEREEILNDETVEVLAKIAVSHAQAGSNFVAPSDMMDGRVQAIRTALETNGFIHTGIMAYSAKYASCFYGPFRDALDSTLGFSDKKTYQMNPANQREGIKEALLDIAEGADIVMIKPAMLYLDVIKSIKEICHAPLSAYQVSGEYAMIKAAAQKGWLNEQQAMIETLVAIKRSRADLIATYFVKDIIRTLELEL